MIHSNTLIQNLLSNIKGKLAEEMFFNNLYKTQKQKQKHNIDIFCKYFQLLFYQNLD